MDLYDVAESAFEPRQAFAALRKIRSELRRHEPTKVEFEATPIYADAAEEVLIGEKRQVTVIRKGDKAELVQLFETISDERPFAEVLLLRGRKYTYQQKEA